MNRVKTGRKKKKLKLGGGGQRSDGREVRKRQGGRIRETPRATPAPGDQEAEKLGFEAVEAAEREGAGIGEIKGTWHSGEVEKRALPRPRSERTEQRTREKGKSRSGKARPQRPSRTQ